MGSSAIHEYYQLPLQIFLCPLMGRGWKSFHNFPLKTRMINSISTFLLVLLTSISLIILSIDYYLVEKRQSAIWMPLVTMIRKEVNQNSRIVAVTSSDPTLLNLSRRQGWSPSIDQINEENIELWTKLGATHLVGSLNWAESYMPLDRIKSRKILEKYACKKNKGLICKFKNEHLYFIPLQR